LTSKKMRKGGSAKTWTVNGGLGLIALW
jgi:hypothetical protein